MGEGQRKMSKREGMQRGTEHGLVFGAYAMLRSLDFILDTVRSHGQFLGSDA